MAENQLTIKEQTNRMFNGDAIKKKFTEVLGRNGSAFASSVLSVVNSSADLSIAEPKSVYGAALTAATLNLPVLPSLGMSAIIAYKDNKRGTYTAQWQLMYKGLVELCQRSGQFKTIINEVVYEGQLVKKNKFTGEYVFDEDAKKSDKIIGYMAYMELVNGFTKTAYMTVDEVKAHAQKFSVGYRFGAGIWKDNFDAMGLKTVLKGLLSKYAPKSVEIQQAIRFDQAAIIADEDTDNIEEAEVIYVDNQSSSSEDLAQMAAESMGVKTE